ncbi:MAG: nicotinate phosphoribosyltransferase [Gemmatimonadota bacterium]
MPWVGTDNMALLVDQYELTMLRAYYEEEMTGPAVFSLFFRRLPEHRNYILACGLDTVLSYLERLRFTDEALTYLASMGEFDDAFLDWLGKLRFRGDVWAMPEGTPVFENEPLIEVVASLPEAQVAETFIMNQVHFQTVLASKAARVKHAAGERAVIDFGIRRMHGADAALRSARAYHVAGIDGTSNVLAGQAYEVPVTGTMAHSYIQAHDDEMEAFRVFARIYPETVLLVDTYGTLEGVRKVVRLAEELGDDFRVRGVRLDSGDLGELARGSRGILDAADLDDVEIFASGGLDEWAIRDLVRDGAPIDGFGVGTGMGVSADAPSLDMAYKLAEYDGRGRLKLSSGKPILPGRKQVFRVEEAGSAVRDVIGRAEESGPGRPLMVKVMAGGERLAAGRASLEDAREHAREELARLPDRVLGLEAASPPYAVSVSEALRDFQEEVTRTVAEEESAR